MYRWTIEHLEFGICMFDPAGLLDRYGALQRWDGRWLNYWTETVGDADINVSDERPHLSKGTSCPSSTSDLELIGKTIDTSAQEFRELDEKDMLELQRELRQQREHEKKHKAKPPRHFIVVPGKTARDGWEKVYIRHAEDEVQAHCGLFIRDLNEEYDMLVSRVAGQVDYWCRGIVLGHPESLS